MTNKAGKQLLVIVLSVLYWIILPIGLYITTGTQGLIAFVVLNLVTIGGKALVVGRP